MPSTNYMAPSTARGEDEHDRDEGKPRSTGRATPAAALLVLVAFAAGIAVAHGRAVAQVPSAPVANRVYIPVLDFPSDFASCVATVNVMNLGPEPAKALLLLWPELDPGDGACQAPSRVLCSGLLRPASAWDFTMSDLATEARAPIWSGVVYSFTARRLSEIGASGGGDAVVADHMCEVLRAEVGGDCAAYSAFAAAFERGASYMGVPMDRAAGSPLAVEVHRACPATTRPGVDATSLYAGTGAHALGSTDASFGGYRYHAAPIRVEDGGLTSTIYVQNAGAAAANVELWLQAAGACDGGRVCRTLSVDPGASAIVAPKGCVSPGWIGSAWLRSSAPLAVVVDTAGREGLTSFSAVAPELATAPTGAPALTTTSHAAFGPLAYDTERGWEVEVTVQNLSLTEGAEVGVDFLDASGAVVSSREGPVCARGSASFVLPMHDVQNGSRVGSIRVVSRAPGGDPGAEPAPIAAVATLRKFSDMARSAMLEATAYNLVPESTAFRWPVGGGAGGTTSGSAIIALPAFWNDLDNGGSWRDNPPGVASELVITNLVPVPGWTEFAILFYDQNDLVGVRCRSLAAGQTMIDPLIINGAIPYGFRGSALISATFWEHPVPADAAGPARQLVGLGAVAIRRRATYFGDDLPGDESASVAGVPLPAWPAAVALPPDPCGSMSRPESAPPEGGFWQALVPVFADRAGYNSVLTVRNAGTEPTAVRFHFKSIGDCLRERICTLGTLGAGEEGRFLASDCVGPDWLGSVVLHSREPLVVNAVAEGLRPTISTSGRPGRLPFDVDADGTVDSGDRAAIEAAKGSRPSDPTRNQRADLDASGRIDDTDLWFIDQSLCGADRAPGSPELGLAPALPGHALLPALRFEGDDNVCFATITAQSLGTEPSKLLLVTWGPPAGDGSCKGPIAVACSGLLRPGRTWTFTPATLPAEAKSGAIFSANMRPLSQLGATVGGDEPAADYLCRTLPQTLVGDCDAYRRFKAAYDAGADFEGVPLGKTGGGAIAVDVRRECPADASPDVVVTASYAGIGPHELGAADPALGGAFLFHVPLIYADKAGFNSPLYVQNAGSATATAKLWFQAQDDCSGSRFCGTLTIAPGEAMSFDPARNRSPAGCVGPDWQGDAWLESDQPLAVVIDILGRDVLNTYRAMAPEIAFDANGTQLPAGGRTTAFGPLFFSLDAGWDNGVQVQNLSRTRPAQVRVEFIDDRGAPLQVFDDLICAAGTQTYFLPVDNAEPQGRIGSLRVVSQRPAGDPAAAPAPIAAVALMFRWSDPARSQSLAAGMYTLHSEREALARTSGGAGGTDAGIGAVALVGLTKAGRDENATSALAISNYVRAPGWTQAAVMFYDANGLVETVCQRISHEAVAYLDLAALPLAAGYRGAAIVSATEWRHPIGGGGNGPLRNLVGLGAVAVARGTSDGGDELAVAEGMPLARVAAALGGDTPVRCAVVPTATATPPTDPARTPSPTSAPPRTPTMPRPTATPGGDARIWLPIAWRSRR